MYTRYLITGASGFLGSTVIDRLVSSSAEIFALTLPDDRLADRLPAGVVRVCGDVSDRSSLAAFFDKADGNTCLIHCAGIVTVASRPGDRLYQVNVGGTENILAGCAEHKVAKLVYVSSVHAIPELPKGQEIKETDRFSPESVCGAYAKSKAAATRAVMAMAAQGLNASIVFPSGIIGPHDEAGGSISGMIAAFLSGGLPYAVKGGYDFVDVRDVADGIISCTEKGERGEGYILSGHYATVKEIIDCIRSITGIQRKVLYFPMGIARMAAPLYERIALRKKEKPFYTPYAVKVLASNGRFSNEKARRVLQFCPRPLRETLEDTVTWMKRTAPANG